MYVRQGKRETDRKSFYVCVRERERVRVRERERERVRGRE